MSFTGCRSLGVVHWVRLSVAAWLAMLTEEILKLRGVGVLVVVFVLPALEASAFVGFVFPGEIAVVLGGVAAFEHRAALPAVMAAAILGAIVGDTIGYVVGRRWGRQILEGTVGRFVSAEHLARSEALLVRLGGFGVLAGRFTAVFRVLVPGLAGMTGMEYRRFVRYNVIGGIIWAGGFVLLGFVAGNGWRRVEHAARAMSLGLGVGVVIVVALFVLRRRRVRRRLSSS